MNEWRYPPREEQDHIRAARGIVFWCFVGFIIWVLFGVAIALAATPIEAIRQYCAETVTDDYAQARCVRRMLKEYEERERDETIGSRNYPWWHYLEDQSDDVNIFSGVEYPGRASTCYRLGHNLYCWGY